MSVTRLLILGAVRIFQPTHGYFVRRELGTWQAAEWAHLNPGSVYNALRGLSKEGMLVEEPAEPGEPGSRTRYRLTVDGEQEFLRLVREGLWELHPYEPSWLLAGMSFWGALSRDEVLAALEARRALLTARISGTGFAVQGMPETAAGTPDHVVEMFHIHLGQLRAELDWTHAVSDRILGGAYGFKDEDPNRLRPREHPMRPPGHSLRQ
jgi:DNA-binding PadR family transcriptional regulator